MIKKLLEMVIVSSSEDKTVFFDYNHGVGNEIHNTLETVYGALQKKGYDPVNQIVGYLISGDPAYIPRADNARKLIGKYERDEIIEELVRTYLNRGGLKS